MALCWTQWQLIIIIIIMLAGRQRYREHTKLSREIAETILFVLSKRCISFHFVCSITVANYDQVELLCVFALPLSFLIGFVARHSGSEAHCDLTFDRLLTFAIEPSAIPRFPPSLLPQGFSRPSKSPKSTSTGRCPSIEEDKEEEFAGLR